MNDKKENTAPAEQKELDLEDLDTVVGGGNPFADYARVDNQQIDQDIKDKA